VEVTFIQNGPWFLSLPPCSAQVPCGPGEHTLRWEAGQLQLPSHPDAEAELVLAALGGEKAGCVRLAEVWGRHAEDLAVLQVGPRGPGDEITVGWDDVPKDTDQGGIPPGATGQAGHAGWAAMAGPVAVAMPGPIRFPMRPGHGPQQFRQAMAAQLKQTQQRTADLLSLLALGPAFGYRLTGHVAAAHAERLAAENRPALTAAIAGRLAPVAEDWIGIDPDQVAGTLHGDEGWGSVEMTGKGADRRLRVAIPIGWLASVWACGLALVSRHLVVAVVRPGWPDAQVLAVRAPGSEPVLLDVHGTEGPRDTPHWET
jgi:hypothetical protein